MTKTLGIDFGTVYCRAAFVNAAGIPEVIQSSEPFEASALFPVLLKPLENGRCAVGWQARREKGMAIVALKRFFTNGFQQPEQKKWIELFGLSLENEEEIKMQGTCERRLKISDLTAALLKEIKRQAEQAMVKEFSNAVIGFPFFFEEKKRQLLISAALAAGFESISLIPETKAAALAYSFLKKKRGKVGIFQWGGGTFEIAFLNLKEDGFDVISSAGAPLGGLDMDWCIAQNFIEEMRNHVSLEILNEPGMIQRVLSESERAKCALSHRGSYDLRIAEEQYGIQFVHAFSRYELTQWTSTITERTLDLCREALATGGLTTEDISEVILAGGLTRMPSIQLAVEKCFGRKPTCEINPDQPVVLGAAIHGHLLTG